MIVASYFTMWCDRLALVIKIEYLNKGQITWKYKDNVLTLGKHFNKKLWGLIVAQLVKWFAKKTSKILFLSAYAEDKNCL